MRLTITTLTRHNKTKIVIIAAINIPGIISFTFLSPWIDDQAGFFAGWMSDDDDDRPDHQGRNYYDRRNLEIPKARQFWIEYANEQIISASTHEQQK